MKALVIGKGQLGSYVLNNWNNFNNIEIDCLDYPEFDITNFEHCKNAVENYDIIINCAAFTNVDDSNNNFAKCFEINSFGPIKILENVLLLKKDVKFIHISSEAVYGSNNPFYASLDEESIKLPVNAYSQSKLCSDIFLENINYYTNNILVLRSGWLFGPDNDHNFIEKIKKVMLSKKSVKVVNDQIGSLTSVDVVLSAIKCFLKGKIKSGIYNIANRGFVSRYEIAKFVRDTLNIDCELSECSSDEFVRPVEIHKNSCLNCMKLKSQIDFNIPDWRIDVSKVLENSLNNKYI